MRHRHSGEVTTGQWRLFHLIAATQMNEAGELKELLVAKGAIKA
jgi:hypothetical protein